MELNNGDVFFTSRLLSLHKSGRVVEACDQATSDLWIEGTGVTSLVSLEDSLDPGNDLMGGWVGWLIEVDDTVLLEDVHWSLEWGVTTWEWSEVVGLDIQKVIVL